MAALSIISRLVRPHARNCPIPAMEDAILIAAREFCRRTRWLRETIILPIVAGTARYSLTPTDTLTVEVIGVKAVEWYGEPLDPMLQEAVADEVLGFYYYEPPADLLLSWTPADDVADQMQVRLILQLLDDVTAIPDHMARKWDMALSYGALEWLLSQEHAAWYSPTRAAFFGAKWNAELNKAQLEADREHTPAGFRVQSYS